MTAAPQVDWLIDAAACLPIDAPGADGLAAEWPS
jgi:hypothetical protein